MAKLLYTDTRTEVVSVCAWCSDDTYPELEEHQAYTHGICETHLRKLRKHIFQRQYRQSL